MTLIRTAAALAVVLLLDPFGSFTAAQSDIGGSWELTAYESTASVGKASGLLTFASGRFSLVYTMEEPSGRTSGRAHAGRFRISGDTMTLDVDWTMEYVGGKGQAQRGGGGRRSVKIAQDGNTLTLTYENNSVQRFERVSAAR